MFCTLPRCWKKSSPACGRTRSPKASEAFCVCCAIARCNSIGTFTSFGGPESLCPPPPMLVFDFSCFADSGGAHCGSLSVDATIPYGRLGNGTFLPLMRSEKSSVEI